MKSFVVSLLLASLANLGYFASSTTLQSLSEHDWTQINSPLNELSALQNMPFVFNDLQITGRIVGGSLASTNQFPHQAALFVNTDEGQFFCGGSIISKNVILTAAHCVVDENSILANNASVYVGLLNVRTGPAAWGTIVQRNQMRAHELYNSNSLTNDIAFIRLHSDVPIQANVQIIPLPTRAQTVNLMAGETATASGWGRVSDKSNEISSVLKFVSNPIIGNNFCRRYFGSYILSTNICLSGAGARGTCQGDSGGPLVVIRNGKSTLVGITSFGSASGCQIGSPTVFTRVGSFLDWLRTNADIVVA